MAFNYVSKKEEASKTTKDQGTFGIRYKRFPYVMNMAVFFFYNKVTYPYLPQKHGRGQI